MGSVDWNKGAVLTIYNHGKSLPVWGAWIEIFLGLVFWLVVLVAPCMGSVDWNLLSMVKNIQVQRRSLYGERGLKSWFSQSIAIRFRRSLYGERGLKSREWDDRKKENVCRSLYGERGLKCNSRSELYVLVLSLPVWGAWIEIYDITGIVSRNIGRSLYGERGLKYSWLFLGSMP